MQLIRFLSFATKVIYFERNTKPMKVHFLPGFSPILYTGKIRIVLPCYFKPIDMFACREKTGDIVRDLVFLVWLHLVSRSQSSSPFRVPILGS